MPQNQLAKYSDIPPERWKTFGSCSFNRKTMTVQGENPIAVVAASKEDILAAIYQVNQWMEPASKEELYVMLGKLHLASATKSVSSEDFKAALKIYAHGLQKYPGDIVVDTISKYAGKFYPALNELIEAVVVDVRYRERCRVLKALIAYFDDWGSSIRVRKPVTPAQLKRMETLLQGLREQE